MNRVKVDFYLDAGLVVKSVMSKCALVRAPKVCKTRGGKDQLTGVLLNVDTLNSLNTYALKLFFQKNVSESLTGGFSEKNSLRAYVLRKL